MIQSPGDISEIYDDTSVISSKNSLTVRLLFPNFKDNSSRRMHDKGSVIKRESDSVACKSAHIHLCLPKVDVVEGIKSHLLSSIAS